MVVDRVSNHLLDAFLHVLRSRCPGGRQRYYEVSCRIAAYDDLPILPRVVYPLLEVRICQTGTGLLNPVRMTQSLGSTFHQLGAQERKPARK